MKHVIRQNPVSEMYNTEKDILSTDVKNTMSGIEKLNQTITRQHLNFEIEILT